MNWFWSLLTGASAAAASVPVTPSTSDRRAKRKHILQRLAAPRATTPVQPFAIPRPMPGVVPSDIRTMAQDDALTSATNWAGTASIVNEGLVFLGYPYLAQLAQRPEYRHISETMAREMTRKWITLHAPGGVDKTDRINALNEALDRYHIRDVFRRCLELDGMFGRGHLFFDFGDDPSSDELMTQLIISPAKIKKGSLKRVTVVEPVWVYPASYNSTDPLKPDYYKPSLWYVMSRQVHRTRLLTFVGREMPDLLKPAYSFGGMSLSQMAKPYVDHWLRTRTSVSDLVNAFSTMVLSTDLDTMMEETDDGSELFSRVDFFNRTRNNRGTMVVDKDSETLTNITTNLGTLDKLMAQSQEQMASVALIPLVKLLGITPSGLNASSDGEIRVFYDTLEANFQHQVAPNLRIVLNIIQMSEFGEIDPDIDFRFEPLWQLDESAKASIRKTNADTAASYIQDGVLSAAEERARLAEQEESGIYAGLDLNIEIEPPGGGEPPSDEDEQPPSEPPPDTGGGPQASGGNKLAGDKEFVEGEHKRDHGQFSSTGGGSAATSPRGHLVMSKVVGGKRVQANGSPLPAHIQALRVPPAWTDVLFSPTPDSKVLAQGKDAAGRRQTLYSPSHNEGRDAKKFAQADAMHKQFPKILKQNAQAQKSADAALRDNADCMDMILKMGVRPGSERDTGAKQQAYGATTLQGRHVVKEKGKTFLRFIGKDGVSLNLPVTDKAIAENLSQRALRSGAGGSLFPHVTEKSILAHAHTLGDGSFKTKDFRTHLGTTTASDLVSAMPVPKDAKSYKLAVKEVAKGVSAVLGNTPVIALQSYINPAVFAAWRHVA